MGPALARAAPNGRNHQSPRGSRSGRAGLRRRKGARAAAHDPRDHERHHREADERGAPAERQGHQRQRQAAGQHGRRDGRLLDAEGQPLALERHLVGHEQVDRRLGYRVRDPGHRQQGQQDEQRLRQGGRGHETGGGHQQAAAHGTQRAHSLGQPAAGAGAEGARREEHGDAGGHRGHAHVEVAADLQRERSDQEAGHHGGRAGRDGERGRSRQAGLWVYASPTRFAIVITPITHRTMPMMSNTAPALIMRVIGSMPEEYTIALGGVETGSMKP